jgi:hypothetical protein
MSVKITGPDESGKDGVATKPQRTAEELRQALHTCEINRRDTKAKKKSITGGYNQILKDIDLEINDLLDQLHQLEPSV